MTANLSAPLATAYPPLLKASLNAAQMIILNAWPRIAHHRGEILKGLTLCWCRLRVEETKSKELKDIQRDIERTTKLLTSVVRRIVDVVEEYQVLINSDSRLWELLTV